jgi:hypothetical protein
MASIQVTGYSNVAGLIPEQAIREFIELFFEGDKDIHVQCTKDVRELRRLNGDRKIKDRTRGEHRYLPVSEKHVISLVAENIEKSRDDQPCGGNIPPPHPSVKAAMILAHEIKHANQYYAQGTGDRFWGRGRKYTSRACERDARQFVDERIGEICAYFAVDPPRPHLSGPHPDQGVEVETIAEVLADCSEVTLEDIKEELRRSGCLNPANVARVVEMLRAEGFEL